MFERAKKSMKKVDKITLSVIVIPVMYHIWGEIVDRIEFRAALKRLGWSQNIFCRHTGLHRNTVSKWMVGKTKLIPKWVDAYLACLEGKSEEA